MRLAMFLGGTFRIFASDGAGWCIGRLACKKIERYQSHGDPACICCLSGHFWLFRSEKCPWLLVCGQKFAAAVAMASSAAASTTFVFREQKVVLIKTEQLVKLHGPWPTGRGTFKRGKTSVNNIVHDKSAAHMLERIEKSAAQAEVRARPRASALKLAF